MLGSIPGLGKVFIVLGGWMCEILSQPPEAVVAIAKASCVAIFGGSCA